MVVGLESWREALSLTQNYKLEVTMEASLRSWVCVENFRKLNSQLMKILFTSFLVRCREDMVKLI